jgi:phosphoglycerol transferase
MTTPERPLPLDARTFAAVACVLAAFFVFFVIRGVGLEPLVFADEWTHSVSARLIPLSDVFSPSYFYYYLYRPTKACGFAFLECARLYNIGFFLAAGFLFFLYARRFVSTGLSVLMLVVFLGVPGNLYVLLFSPDALFYSVFVVFFLSLMLIESRARGPVAGFLFGLLALIKINAILLFPGVVLYLLLEWWLAPRRFLDCLVGIVLFVAFFALAKMGVGYLIAGPNGLSITGRHYSQVASQGLDLAFIFDRLPLLLFSVSGYLASVVLLLATPLVALFGSKQRAGEPDRMLGYAAVCMVLPSLFLFGLFAAMVADAGPYESIRRLSLRYFGFVLPFFYLFGLSILTRLDATGGASGRTRTLSVVAVIATVLAILGLSQLYMPILTESPELLFLVFNRTSLIAGTAALLVPLLLLIFRPALAARGYLASLLVLAIVWNIVGMRELRPLRTPTPFDAAGRYAAMYLGNERANVAVVSTDLGGLFRAMFHLDAAGPVGIQLSDRLSRDELLGLLRSKKWALLVGPDALRFAPPDTPAPSGFAVVPTDVVAARIVGQQ